MATQFQQRLVGTVILVALGVIFLPDLLDGKQQLAPDEAVTIPLRPELEPARPLVSVPEHTAVGHQADKAPVQGDGAAEAWVIEEAKEAPPVAPKPAAAAPAPQPAAPQPTPQPKPAPVVKAAPVIQPAPAIKQVAPQQGDHIVQLGAFRNADNVNALVKKLQAAGYRAQTTPSVPRHGELNRVWIGPDDKARLEQHLAALERLTGLKGRVRAQ
ncbi:cell division protein DedD [Oceanisphaera sp.]|uniref:cell division protein DedD n=1 Tax=Oceanisphaera sp. TaxID=1929979 RepID=UPI003A951299